MSILIRGMRFPKTCDECLINCGHSMLYIGITDRRSPNCPLVEIPTPHGDLVDRDKLLAEYDRQHKGPAGGARRIMEQADAVIEAEGSEE